MTDYFSGGGVVRGIRTRRWNLSAFAKRPRPEARGRRGGRGDEPEDEAIGARRC